VSVKHGLLSVLERRSMHGYELRRELADGLGSAWALNYGQVYSTLERLVRDGMVVQSETVASGDAPDRKLYTITPAGRAELRNWFLTPADGAETGRDELYAKILLSFTSDVPAAEVFQAQRRGQLRRIALLTELKERLDPQLELAEILQADLSIAKTDAAIKWLGTAEAKLKKSAASTPQGVAPTARQAVGSQAETPQRQGATRKETT
jgi:DNA-binding PadR family transcriptional regulator